MALKYKKECLFVAFIDLGSSSMHCPFSLFSPKHPVWYLSLGTIFPSHWEINGY